MEKIPTFGDVQFMTAADKVKVYRQWVRFIEKGLRWDYFTKALYDHLHLHCSFIAHYDRYGFYGYYFDIPERTLAFLKQFDPDGNGRSAELGMNHWLSGDHADINDAMRKAITPHVAGLRERFTAEIRARDISQAQALLARHDIKMPEAEAVPVAGGGQRTLI